MSGVVETPALGLLFGGDLGWTALALTAALLLDAAYGEPKALYDRVPHPAVLMGKAVDTLDYWMNRDDAAPTQRRWAGVVALSLLGALAVAIGVLLQFTPIIGPLLAILGGASLLAHKSLVEHVEAVADGLEIGLASGRRAVSHIVGRDPESLDEAGVARAAVESAAENFSDAVAAPAFWFLLGGLPGIVLYKLINTADSMVGHRTPRHEAFGWASARADDVANWAPARLSALLIALASRRPRAVFGLALDEAHKHASPNAGWPEAAAAGALDLALGGPRRYGDQVSADRILNPKGRPRPTTRDIRQATILIGRAHVGLVATIVAFVAIDLAVA